MKKTAIFFAILGIIAFLGYAFTPAAAISENPQQIVVAKDSSKLDKNSQKKSSDCNSFDTKAEKTNKSDCDSDKTAKADSKDCDSNKTTQSNQSDCQTAKSSKKDCNTTAKSDCKTTKKHPCKNK